MVLSAKTTPTADEVTQSDFIKSLGPYYKQAKAKNQLDAFLERAFNIWRFRWPLRRCDYFDDDFMEAAWASIKRKKTVSLYWAAFAGGGCAEYDWETYLAICEARAGIAKECPSNKRKRDSDDPSIKPRPKPRKRAVLVNEGVIDPDSLPKKWKEFGSE